MRSRPSARPFCMPTRSDNESCSAENRADSIEVSPAIFLLILFYCPQNCNIALSYYGVHSLDVFA